MNKSLLLFIIFLLFINLSFGLIIEDAVDCDDNPNDDPSVCNDVIDCSQEKFSVCAKCIHPGALEVCDDNIDNNCNADFSTLLDNDPETGVDSKDLECITECGDANLDIGESCFTCPSDAGCNQGEICLNVENQWGCVPIQGPSECGNNILELGETCSICQEDAPLGFCDLCNDNNICEIGETCLCTDCIGQQSICKQGNVCNEQGVCVVDPNDGICTNDETAKKDDPECCSIINVNWGINLATRNTLVDLIVEGNEYCKGRVVNFGVYEDELGEDTYVPPDPPSRIFNSEAKSIWSVVNVDDGFFQGQPEFYFIATSAISSKQSDLLGIIKCQENDGDCDGIINENDKCPDTPLEEIKNVDSSGCAPGEASCVTEWDCTKALWTECNEQGYRTRDINKCIYRGSNPICESKFKPLSRQACLLEEAFPVFTTFNILITLLILVIYYIIIIGRNK